MNLQGLIENSNKIIYFGLGMIQISMNNGKRLNFYTPELKPNIEGSIHTHRAGFTSEILAGSLEQYTFSLAKGDSYNIIETACKETCERNPVGQTGLQLECVMNLNKGSHYTLGKDTIHSVSCSSYKGCITEVEFMHNKQDNCLIFIKQGEVDENPFINIPEQKLWQYVGRMIDEHFN